VKSKPTLAFVRVAKPATAKGTVFVNLEDETGLVNVICTRGVWKRFRTVARGGRYVGPDLADLLVAGVRGDPNAPLHSILSEREFQIFCKLAQGESVSEIANRLFLSVKTVSTYRSRILEKMSMKSNADITTYALRNNLVQ